MAEQHERELCDDIDAAVREVPGVAAIFAPPGAVSKAVDLGARMIGIRASDTSSVRVKRGDGGVRVELGIGVRATAGAVETSHRVQAAIRALCADRGEAIAQIHVTVVHVEDDRARAGSRR